MNPAASQVSFAEQTRRKQHVLAELERYPFHAPWWLRSRHLQTSWGHFLRRQPPAPGRRERWDTPDLDFLDVQLFAGDLSHPVVVLLHGLEGSLRSNYVVGLSHAFAGLNWGVAAMEFRSCGGEVNRARRMYHSGETTDLAFVVDSLARRWPGRRLYLAGYSLGGNVTAKWLGECGEALPAAVAGAAVTSVPYDLAASAAHFESSLWGLYSRRFLRTLVPKAIEKERQYPGCVDIERVKQSRTFADFDTHATARLHGFRDAADYWSRSSSGQFLLNIRRPTLLLSSADDPFNPSSTLPRAAAEESPYLHGLFTQRGGHVGFVHGPSPLHAHYWAEEQIVRFFTLYDSLA